MSIKQTFLDAWENIFTGLGGARDKRTGGRALPPSSGNDLQTFDDLYHGNDMAATIVDVPAKEATREWFDVRIGDDSDAAKAVAQKLDDLNAQQHTTASEIWARVYGGSLMFLGVDDGTGADPRALAEPFDMKRIKSFSFLQVFDRWDVSVREYYTNPRDPKYRLPRIYDIRQGSTPGNSLGLSAGWGIHESRFIRFDGSMTSWRRWQQNGGWNDSVFVRIMEVLRDYGMSWSGAAHLLQDFAQATFKIKGLAAALAGDNDGYVIARLKALDIGRSLVRAIPLDADGESFERQATPVSGLPELLDRFSIRLAAAARMPVTLLFGQSPAGLNATGDSDVRFFYDSISAHQEHILRPKMNRLVELIFASADGPTGGKEPADWSIEFRPLWQLDEKEQADVRLKQAQADQIYISTTVLTPDEVAESRFAGDKYSTATALDEGERETNEALDKTIAESVDE